MVPFNSLQTLPCECTGFLRSDQLGQLAAGIIFAIILPCAYIGFTMWLVLRFLVHPDPTKRAAVYVVSVEEHEQEELGEDEERGEQARDANYKQADSQSGIARVSASSSGTAASAGSSQRGGRRNLLRRGSGSGGNRSGPGRPGRLRSASAWLARFVSRTLLGYCPHEQGKWMSTTPGSSFVERYGAVFQTKGPAVRYIPGTYQWSGDGRGLDRGTVVPVQHLVRAREVRQALQALGTTVGMLRLILVADILASMKHGVDPVLPVTLQLVVTVLYCLFLRFVTPPHTLPELTVEALLMLFSLGSIVCGIMLAATPPTEFKTT
jgi:hypothetical protein